MGDLIALLDDERMLAKQSLRPLTPSRERCLKVLQQVLLTQSSLNEENATDIGQRPLAHGQVPCAVKPPCTMFRNLIIDPLHGFKNLACVAQSHMVVLSILLHGTSHMLACMAHTVQLLSELHNTSALQMTRTSTAAQETQEAHKHESTENPFYNARDFYAMEFCGGTL